MNEYATAILRNLIIAAKPFTSGDIVDETSGTAPLISQLRMAIKKAEELIPLTFPFKLTDDEVKRLYSGKWVTILRGVSEKHSVNR